MRKLGFTRKLGFIIGIIVLLMAVMPVSDSLPAQAAEPPPPVPQEAPRLPLPQEPPPVIDGHGTGFIPPTMDLSHITGQRMPDGSLVGESPVAAPPATFDWRTAPNRVTSVKNQGGCGSCYAFAALGNVESKVLIDTNTTPSSPDYSENNAKECNWRELNAYGCPAQCWGSCNGGDYRMLASLFSQKGIVLETDDPYVASNVSCNSSCPYNKTLLDWRIISTGSVPNTTALKNYIMTYGPVYTTVYVDSGQGFHSGYNGSYTFNYTSSGTNNHAVLIVGWSNNLPPDQVTGLPGDGWIVKNSWGAGWGAGGYFYIRYGAASIGEWSSFMHSWQDYDNNGGIMYYDEDCWDASWGWGPPTNFTAWGLCNFTPANNTYATRVEFWTTDATTDIDIYIYDDFNVATTSLSNLLRSQTDYSFTELGYHGVNLSSPLALTAGDDVIVVVKFTNSGYTFPVPADPNGPSEINRTYLSLTGSNGSWTDMGAFTADDVAIRLRTSVPVPCGCGDICVSTTGWWRNGGIFNASATPIQSAVNNAAGGDTICVKDGNYNENVDVNTANLTIQSENGNANCVVNATNSNDYVFYVAADWVNITGFTVENATGGSRAGICLGSGVSHCNISSNNATNNYYGIYLWSSSNNMLTDNTANSNSFYSIYLSSSSNNTLINNTASHNNGTYGIYLVSSSNNTLQNNDGEDNLIGIRLSTSSNNTLDNNTANSNNYGIYLTDSSSNNNLTNNTANSNNDYGIHLEFSDTNNITGNEISGSSCGIYLYSSHNNEITNNNVSYNDNDGIKLGPVTASSYNNITDNVITHNGQYGIYFHYFEEHNTIFNNTISNNSYGIFIENANNNDIIANVIVNNQQYGIDLTASSNNTIYNNYFSNTNNAWDNGTNTWNTTNSTGPNIVGGLYIGGNYWSDYTGNDTTGDGFGDTQLPYNCTGNITNGGDYLPLIPTGATLEGHINFTGAVQGPEWVRELDVTFFDNATQNETAWSPMTATTNSSGWFNVSGLDPGTYDIGIKNCTSLSEMNMSVTLTPGNTTVVDFGDSREGDCNEDDMVTSQDRGLLYDGWNSFNVTQDGHLCDLNRDTMLTSQDRGLMYDNWNTAGDVLLY